MRPSPRPSNFGPENGATRFAGRAWFVNPLRCPVCPKQMRVIAFIDPPEVVGKTLRDLNLWRGPAAFAPARPPPGSDSSEPEFPIGYDVMPEYENVLTD